MQMFQCEGNITCYFKTKKTENKPQPQVQLEGKRLVPTHSDKYLEVLTNEHLIIWNKQITQIII